MRRFVLSGLIVLLTAMARPLAADSPALIDCPFTGLGADTFAEQAFYVPRYTGITLDKVTLYLEFPYAGTYTLSLTARAGSFSGSVLGTATTTVTAPSRLFTDEFLPVAFAFASPVVRPQFSTVTFQGTRVSGPAGFIGMVFETPAGCPVVETYDATPPLSRSSGQGVAVRIEGGYSAEAFVQTWTIPSIASIHGLNGTYFHTDLWLYNHDVQDNTVTARYRCLSGQNCGTGTATFVIGAGKAKTISDVVPTLFGSTETAGALELSVTPFLGQLGALYALSRTYSPALPAATTGASFAALPASGASGLALFVGLAGNAGDLSTGFRTNVGVYNPQEVFTSVKFYLYRVDGALLGSTSLTLAAHEARQLNDIFAAVGAGSVVATDAYLAYSSDVPIFGFATVIDNRTGDFVYQGSTRFY